jgi:predicted SprT family Zn-dependent metalloprotease
MTDRNDIIIMEEDLNENDWQDVNARFHALLEGKYGTLWSQITQKTTAARSPAAALTEQFNRLPTAATGATGAFTPTNMQVRVVATTSSCRCGCTPNTTNSFLPSDMLQQQENQTTATPAARWTPLLEDALEDDEEEEDSEDDESEEEESQFHRRVLEFDSENDDDTGVIGGEEGDDVEDEAQDEDDGDESGDQDSDNSSSSGGSTVIAFNNVSFHHSPASGGSVEHQDGVNSSLGTDPNVAASLPKPGSLLFSPTTRALGSSDVTAGNLNELSLREAVSPAFGPSDEESIGRAGTSNEPSLYEQGESSPPLESPGFVPPAQDATLIDAATSTLNALSPQEPALSLHELESLAQESLLVDATAGTLNESSLAEPESPAFAQPVKVKGPEVIDLIDSSSDEERESSPVIASSLKASQTIELVSSSDDESRELLQDRKKKFLARSARPTFRDHSSSSSSEEMEWNEAGAFKSSFSDDNESVEEQSVKPAASSDDYEEDDEDDDASVEQLVQRTNRIVIDSDGDSSTEDDSEEAFRPAKRPPRKSKAAKKSVSKAAFRRSREALGAETFVVFDNAAFGGRLGAASVTLEWSNKLRTTAGLTRLSTSRAGPPVLSASIELSAKVIDDQHRLRSTLLHEMCHAAAWIVDGVHNPPHGKCFQKWARIAMRHVRDIEVTTTHDYIISFKYAWACTTPKCGVVFKRHSRSVDVDKHRCGKCKGKLMEIEVPPASNASAANAEHVPRKKAAPSAYNLFVKENSAPVRKQLEAESGSKVPQPEVMKACARLWREQTPSKK